MKKLILLGSITCILCCEAKAQTNIADKPAYSALSAADSARVKRYLDSAGKADTYSLKHQHYLDSALSVMPYNAYWWQQKAMPLFKQRKYELGMPYLDSAVKYDNTTHWLEYRAFMKCIFSKDYKSSIADFYLARAKGGDGGVMDHPYDFYLGFCYLQLNNFDSCKILIQKCIDKDKASHGDSWVHYMNWFYMGVVNYEQEHYTEALSCFDKALEQYKNFSDVKYYKGLCYEKTKDLKKALELMNEAKKDLDDGYTINEDNAFYEMYPYQMNKAFLNAELRWLNGRVAKEH